MHLPINLLTKIKLYAFPFLLFMGLKTPILEKSMSDSHTARVKI